MPTGLTNCFTVNRASQVMGPAARTTMPRFGEYVRFEPSDTTVSEGPDRVFLSPKPAKAPRLLASFDYDKTLAEQELAVHQVLDKSRVPVFTVLNTGRILPTLQPMLHKYDPHYLKHIQQLNALVTYQGGELYINHQNLPTLEWLKSLTPDQQDPHWQAYLKETRGWDIGKINNVVDAMIDNFEKELTSLNISSSIPFRVNRYSPFPDFVLKPLVEDLEDPPEELIDIGWKLAKMVCDRCSQIGIDVEPFEEWHGPKVGFKIVPKGITKASPLEFLLNAEQHPGFEAVDHVMHAGDGPNDVHALTQTHYAGIPSTGLVCDNDTWVRGAIAKKAEKTPGHSTHHLKFLHDLGHSLSEGLHHLLVELEEKLHLKH